MTVNTPTTYPATFTNFATYGYNDTATSLVDDITGINTNTTTLAFNGWDFAQFTAGPNYTGFTDTFTATTVTGSGSAQNHTTTAYGTNVITAPTSYGQGATIYWQETVTNNGVLTDTYNLTLCATVGGCTPAITNAFPGRDHLPALPCRRPHPADRQQRRWNR